jgi:hypothetical protein
VGGGIILYLDAVARAVCFQANCGPSRGLAYTGVGAMVAGAAALVTGIVLIQPAAVDQSTSLRAQARGPRARPEDWLRTPTWHEPGPEAAALPKAVSIPLLSGSF